MPYLNEERDAQKFEGELNGITVDPDGGPVDVLALCPGGLTLADQHDADDIADDGDWQVPRSAMPAGVVFPEDGGSLEVWLCGDKVVALHMTLRALPDTKGANPGGTTIRISRDAGLEGRIRGVSAATRRWAAGDVLGIPAITLSPILDSPGAIVGDCLVAYRSPATDALAVIRAAEAQLDFCIALGEAIER